MPRIDPGSCLPRGLPRAEGRRRRTPGRPVSSEGRRADLRGPPERPGLACGRRLACGAAGSVPCCGTASAAAAAAAAAARWRLFQGSARLVWVDGSAVGVGVPVGLVSPARPLAAAAAGPPPPPPPFICIAAEYTAVAGAAAAGVHSVFAAPCHAGLPALEVLRGAL